MIGRIHAPAVERIGKGKASAPYEFGVKASIITTNACALRGQFVPHAKAHSPACPTLDGAIGPTAKLKG